MKTILLILIGVVLATQSIGQDGEAIFKQNCASCHLIGKGRMVGPDLKNIHLKYDEEKLFRWIRSSQTVINEGDPDAIALFKEYYEVVMPDQLLSDDELKALVGYITDVSEETVTEKKKPAPSISATSSTLSVVSNEDVSPGRSTTPSRKRLNPHKMYIYFAIGAVVLPFITVLWLLSNAMKVLSEELSKQYKKRKE